LHPDKRVIASQQAHYTHSRISEVLGLDFSAVEVDDSGRMQIEHIEALMRAGDVGTIVATMGNTGLGAVDQLPAILELADQYEVRVHADAAYGGYFGLASKLNSDTRSAFDAMTRVDSIVIDPHKHGLQPYGCGCVLFQNPDVGRFYKHDSPATYFSSAELHLGEISLECSRPGASAVALWATQQLFPLERGGELGDNLDKSLQAARDFHERLKNSEHFLSLMPPELDIVVYAVAAAGAKAASEGARRVFARAAEQDLHLALIELPLALVQAYAPGFDVNTGTDTIKSEYVNAGTVTCLRSVLMKPEHHAWLDTIMGVLEKSAAD
jgi:glutamate/tyrosine decarboxylase-like PLP-dependent enzyme